MLGLWEYCAAVWSFLFASLAQAAPAGEPVPSPALGRWGLTLRYDNDAVAERVPNCRPDDACTAAWRTNLGAAQLRVDPIQGLGFYVEGGAGGERVSEADYRGSAWRVAGGLRGAVFLGEGPWFLGANARVDWGGGRGAELELGGRERARSLVQTGTVLTGLGRPENGLSTWFGVQRSWAWSHTVYALGGEPGTADAGIVLDADRPLTGLAGFTLVSDPVGAHPSQGARVRIGFEARVGQDNGGSAWVGLTR